MIDNSDSELLVQYRNGSVQALEQMVERYRRPLFGFILNMIGAREEADEVFQEVWYRAIKSLDRYRDERFLSWLFRITRNLVIDRYRSRKGWVSLEDENREGIALEDTLPDSGSYASSQAEQRDTGRQIAVAVARLPAPQKEVFLMRMEGELSFREIAGIQRVSINTALARMQYALAKLREMLKDEIDPPAPRRFGGQAR